MTRTSPPLRVGLFVEGSPQDHTRNSIDKLWAALVAHCGTKDVVIVYGIDKSQILNLRPDLIPVRKGATKVRSSRPAIDVDIEKAFREDRLDCAIVAFDSSPPNELITPSCLRTEVCFLLDNLAASKVPNFPEHVRSAARDLAHRYRNEVPLTLRPGTTGPVEVIYMEPAFEALLCSDETTVLRASGHLSRPSGWPSFKCKSADELKKVMPRVTRVAHKDVLRKIGGEYCTHKSAWGLRVVESATSGAKIWAHEISMRLCRLLAALAPSSA